MDLWSKGLGRLVLTLRLSERSGMGATDDALSMKGTMGKPTYWDWSVDLDDDDVVDFLVFLKRPEPVRYLVESEQRWTLLRIALEGAALFALSTLRLMIFGKPARGPSASLDAGPSGPLPSPEPAKEKS